MTRSVQRFKHASLDEVELHYTDTPATNPARDGEQSLVILLHGGGANLHWWSHLVPGLSRVHRVVALDFRGHGDSDHPEALLVGAFHRDLAALIDHLGSQRHALVGHSLGAHVALHHAATHSGVSRLVLVEPSRGAGRRDRRRSLLALAARRSYATRDEAVARFRFVPDAPAASNALRREIAEQSVQREPDGRFGFKFDPRWFGLPTTPQPDLSAVRAPTLVIRGADSRLLPGEGARELCREIPHARLVEIPGAGHNVHIEKPDDVAAALRDHLDTPGGTP